MTWLPWFVLGWVSATVFVFLILKPWRKDFGDFIENRGRRV